MSSVADLFIGDDDADADTIPGTTPAWSTRGLDTLALAQLWAALQAEPYRDEHEAAFEMLDGVSDDGPWLFLVPPDLLSRLAALPVDRIDEIAAAWIRYEESAADPADAANAIRELQRVAALARDQRKSVLLWLSL